MSTINGNVEAALCKFARLNGKVAVGGNVNIHECTMSSGYTGRGVQINGNFECHNNAGACLANQGAVLGDVHIHDNTSAAADVSGNVIAMTEITPSPRMEFTPPLLRPA